MIFWLVDFKQDIIEKSRLPYLMGAIGMTSECETIETGLETLKNTGIFWYFF